MRTQRHRRYLAVLGAAVIALTTATGCGAVHSATSKVKEAAGGGKQCGSAVTEQASTQAHDSRHGGSTDEVVQYAENAVLTKAGYGFCVLAQLDPSGDKLRNVSLTNGFNTIVYTNAYLTNREVAGMGLDPHPLQGFPDSTVHISGAPHEKEIDATFVRKTDDGRHRVFQASLTTKAGFDFSSFKRIEQQVSKRERVKACSSHFGIAESSADSGEAGVSIMCNDKPPIIVDTLDGSRHEPASPKLGEGLTQLNARTKAVSSS
jgi:hypothetical protein